MIAVSSLLLDHNAAGLLTRPLSAAQTMTALLPELPETVYRYSPMFLVALVGHTLARPTRWSTWFFHVMSNRLSAYIDSSNFSLFFWQSAVCLWKTVVLSLIDVVLFNRIEYSAAVIVALLLGFPSH